MRRDLVLVCPRCRGRLYDLRCRGCGAQYGTQNGIPVFATSENGQAHAASQAQWFDEAVDREWEVTRPHGAPSFHQWLLEEKIDRSVEGIELDDAEVLVVCSGSGMEAEILARRGAHVVAVDISPGASMRTIERASRAGFEIQAVVADAQRLPFGDRTFDLAYVHDGLHHLADPERAIEELSRVSRRWISISEPAEAVVTRIGITLGVALEREDAGNRVARMSLGRIRVLMAKHGFSVQRGQRYGMFYRHHPGWPMRFFSLPGVFQLATLGMRAANRLLGRWGNKLVVIGVRR